MHRHTLALLILILACPAVADEGWTRFRGPNGSGVSPSPAPTQWSPADYAWKVELPGEGHSSPVLHRDRVYITATQPQTAEQWLVSVRATDGAIAWKLRLESKPYPQHRFNSFASASPAVDERHVYVPVSSAEEYQLVAVTHEGREAWRHTLGPFVSQHGSAASPIVYRDSVIMPNDQDGESFAIALDGQTGQVRWKTPRKSGNAAYGTPSIFTGADGVDQLILSSQASGVTGLNAATGELLWEVDGLFHDRTVFSPTVAGDLVIAGAGQGIGGKKLVAIRPPASGGSASAELVYEIDKSLPYVPTPLYHEGLLFLLADSGVLTCADAATGQIWWRERIGGNFFASPVIAGDVLYCVSRDGQVVTIQAADTYQPIARTDLGEPTHATPAFAGGVIYLRTERHLIRVGR